MQQRLLESSVAGDRQRGQGAAESWQVKGMRGANRDGTSLTKKKEV